MVITPVTARIQQLTVTKNTWREQSGSVSTVVIKLLASFLCEGEKGKLVRVETLRTHQPALPMRFKNFSVTGAMNVLRTE